MRPIDADALIEAINEMPVLCRDPGWVKAAVLLTIDNAPIIQPDAPRVMTLEELSRIYVEFKNDLIPMSLTHFDLGKIICYMQDGWCRLWSSKPSVEQREAARWDD